MMEEVVVEKLNSDDGGFRKKIIIIIIGVIIVTILLVIVVTSVDSSKGGNLENSATEVVQIFREKYEDAMIVGNTGNVLGIKEKDIWSGGYNFATSGVVIYNLSEKVGSDLNLSAESYILDAEGETYIAFDDENNKTASTDKSFVAFDGKDIIVCLVAKKGGDYYKTQNVSTSKYGKIIKVFDVDVIVGEGKMYSCSNEVNSWK